MTNHASQSLIKNTNPNLDDDASTQKNSQSRFIENEKY